MSIRKKALEALKTKFDGIDEKVLSRIAAKIAKTANDEEAALEAVEEYTLQGVIDSYADSRVTDGLKSYEEKHGLKDGKKVKPEDDDDDETDDDDNNGGGASTTKDGKGKANKDDEMPKWAQALMAKVEAMEKGKEVDARKASFEKAIDKVPENLKKSFRREFSRANFKDEDDFESWLEEITSDIEDASSDANASNSTSGKPKGGGGGKSDVVNPLVQARIDSRNAETKAPAIQGLSTTKE